MRIIVANEWFGSYHECLKTLYGGIKSIIKCSVNLSGLSGFFFLNL